MKARTLILALFIPLILFGGAFWFFLSEGVDRKARAAFEEGDLKLAEENLQSKQVKIPPAEYALYAGYIAREKGDLTRSNLLFQSAIEAEPSLRLKEEIFINQAYNAFLEHNPEKMQTALKGLERKRSVWGSFLANLLSFLKNSSAANLTKLENTPVPPALSPWMATAFSSSFTPFWFGKQTALTLIEEGNTVQARQQLEKIAAESSAGEREEIAYLTGLSYLKEAGERPPLAATPYYRLAFAYFERIPFAEPKFLNGRKKVLEQIQRQLEALLEDKHYDEIPLYAASVEKWGSTEEKKELAHKLSALLDQDNYNPQLAEALSLMTSNPEYQSELQTHALKAIQNADFESTFANSAADISPDWNSSFQILALEAAHKAYEKGDISAAETALQVALTAASSQVLLKYALPLSAQIFLKKGDPYDAVLAWNKSFSLQPLEAVDRVDYGQALMDVLRFDLAKKQFAFMENKVNLNVSEEILYIESLILSGNFEEGLNKALELAPKLNGQEALRLSAIVAPLHDAALNESIAKQIPPKDKWDSALKLAAFGAAIDKGDYDQAARLYAAEKKLLNENAQGKFLLARFYNQIGNSKKALNYAGEALKLNPQLPGLLTFLDQNTFEASYLKERLNAIEQALQKDPLNLSLQLQKGQVMIDYAIALQNKSDLPISKMPELRTAYALLQGLSNQGQEFPFYHFLNGLSAFLLDEEEGAIKAFEKALVLNPSYADAAKYLSLAYSKKGSGASAVQVLLNALKYHPFDGEGWQVLADLYSVEGEGLEAGAALEKALRYRPNNINTLLSMANYKLELQNPLAAQGFVDKVLKINPQNQKALVLKLKILNNPLLTEHQSQSVLKNKTKETLEELRKVNPTLASKLDKELNP